jgi:hypothetical protein
MLIDLSRMGTVTIDPGEYPTTLVIALDAPTDRQDCGVFAGKYEFPESEREKMVPEIIKEEDYQIGLRYFLLDQPEHSMNDRQILRWWYAAIGWDNGVYIAHPYAYEIILEELYSDDGAPTWSVMVSEKFPSFRLILPDYKPGAMLRAVKP